MKEIKPGKQSKLYKRYRFWTNNSGLVVGSLCLSLVIPASTLIAFAEPSNINGVIFSVLINMLWCILFLGSSYLESRYNVGTNNDYEWRGIISDKDSFEVAVSKVESYRRYRRLNKWVI